MAGNITHNVVVAVRVSPEVDALISKAAEARGMKGAEWMRQAIASVLSVEGFDPRPAASPAAGALYDVLDGRKRYARIENGEITAVHYFAERPDNGTWVPVYHEDAEPFDLATKWRLKPEFTVVDVDGTPDHVVCRFPIVEKSLEHA
ncbi:MAG: hypothetical protein JO254_04710 [Pseudolabrys sp.]|nr:hypothetical protein [Pseudolabrys sp.]